MSSFFLKNEQLNSNEENSDIHGPDKPFPNLMISTHNLLT